jgi:hypothetical protein
MDRKLRHPLDPPWYEDPTLLFIVVPALGLLALRLWGG